MTRPAVAIACLIALLVASQGCATIARGTTQTVTVETDPAGATIHDPETGESWTAPAELRLTRRNRHVLTASLPGYPSQEIYIRSEASAEWWIIDAFTLGIGNAIDAIAGGLFELQPSRVRVVFEKEAALD